MRTFDYVIRVSRMGTRAVSADSTMTVDDQRAACVEGIEANGGRVGREHLALDVSGFVSVSSAKFRPALDRVERGEASGLAFAYGTRLARSWTEAAKLVDALGLHGAPQLIIGRDAYDVNSKSGRQRIGMEALMGEMQWWEYKDRAERTADKVILERGVANSVPTGYRRNGTIVNGVCVSKADPERDAKALVLDPDAAPRVVRAFELRRDGWSWRQMSDELDLPIPTLRSMIGNEAYLGVARYGAKRRNEDAHEPLVPSLPFV